MALALGETCLGEIRIEAVGSISAVSSKGEARDNGVIAMVTVYLCQSRLWGSSIRHTRYSMYGVDPKDLSAVLSVETSA